MEARLLEDNDDNIQSQLQLLQRLPNIAPTSSTAAGATGNGNGSAQHMRGIHADSTSGVTSRPLSASASGPNLRTQYQGGSAAQQSTSYSDKSGTVTGSSRPSSSGSSKANVTVDTSNVFVKRGGFKMPVIKEQGQEQLVQNLAAKLSRDATISKSHTISSNNRSDGNEYVTLP